MINREYLRVLNGWQPSCADRSPQPEQPQLAAERSGVDWGPRPGELEIGIFNTKTMRRRRQCYDPADSTRAGLMASYCPERKNSLSHDSVPLGPIFCFGL
jgi:hypothetical protein